MILIRNPEGPRVGVINLDAIGYPNTIDLPDPFGDSPPEPDEPTGNFINRSSFRSRTPSHREGEGGRSSRPSRLLSNPLQMQPSGWRPTAI